MKRISVRNYLALSKVRLELVNMEYNTNTVYVLLDVTDGYMRILCEAGNMSLLSCGSTLSNSGFPANKKSFETLIKMGYEVVQEWT